MSVRLSALGFLRDPTDLCSRYTTKNWKDGDKERPKTFSKITIPQISRFITEAPAVMERPENYTYLFIIDVVPLRPAAG